MTSFSRFPLIFAELRRRKVVRATLAYGVVAGVAMEASGHIVESFGLPPGVRTLVVSIALAGFPLTVLLSWMFDIVPDTGQAAATGSASARPAESLARALPAELTPFIGRDEELAELERLLDGEHRVVTITGPGGVGKTRLALRVAERSAPRYTHGVAYVQLSTLRSAGLILPALANALDMTITRRDDPLAELIDYLHGKRMLIVLDNFEQLTPAAPMLAELVERAPGVTLLVTSRERLPLHGATVLALRGLRTDGVNGSDGDALRLFLASAQRSVAGFTPGPAEREAARLICELLDGVPLAIELAASWVQALTCAEILDALRRDLDLLHSEAADLPERHRSLRAAFDGSWRLLTPREREATASLSVLRGSFDRSAAEDIAAADPGLMRALLDKSLLTRRDDRFAMLDVVRQYALEQLRRAGGESDARARHLRHFAGIAARCAPGVLRADPAALARMGDSIDEFRAAWQHATATRDAAALLQLMPALFQFYDARGWAVEGMQSFDDAVTALRGDSSVPPAATVERAVAALLVRQGVFADRLGDNAAAGPLLREGLDGTRRHGDPGELVVALNRLGAHCYSVGDYGGAELLHEEALELARRGTDARSTAWTLLHLANISQVRGELDDARERYLAALGLMREEQDRNGVWVLVNNLGAIAAMRDDHDEARTWLREALGLQEELGNQRALAMTLGNLGGVASDAGDTAEAREYLERAVALCEQMGYRGMLALMVVNLSDLYYNMDQPVAAYESAVRALHTAAATQSYPVALEAVLRMARLRRRAGDVDGAAWLAAIVAGQAASHDDAREHARRILEGAGRPPAATVGAGDLDALLHEALIEYAAAPTGERVNVG